MIDPDDFAKEIVEPAIANFVLNPASLLGAATVIWSIDSFATHVALARNSQSSRKVMHIEKSFKDSLNDYDKVEHRAFQIIRETSNALKHGIRTNVANIAPTSAVLRCRNVIGWELYFQSDRDVYWGEQIVCELNVEWKELGKGHGRWVAATSAEADPTISTHQTFNYRTVWGLIEPAMTALGYPSAPGSPRLPKWR